MRVGKGGGGCGGDSGEGEGATREKAHHHMTCTIL